MTYISFDMKLLTCAALGCQETFEFDPVNPLKKYHSLKCGDRMRQWHKRHSNRPVTGGPGGGGKRRQMALFSKPPKPAKRGRIPEPVLFPDDGGASLVASFGGAVTSGPDFAQGPIRDHSKYSVNPSDQRKPSARVPLISGGQHAA